jgi:hypothetical protein
LICVDCERKSLKRHPLEIQWLVVSLGPVHLQMHPVRSNSLYQLRTDIFGGGYLPNNVLNLLCTASRPRLNKSLIKLRLLETPFLQLWM